MEYISQLQMAAQYSCNGYFAQSIMRRGKIISFIQTVINHFQEKKSFIIFQQQIGVVKYIILMYKLLYERKNENLLEKQDAQN